MSFSNENGNWNMTIENLRLVIWFFQLYGNGLTTEIGQPTGDWRKLTSRPGVVFNGWSEAAQVGMKSTTSPP